MFSQALQVILMLVRLEQKERKCNAVGVALDEGLGHRPSSCLPFHGLGASYHVPEGLLSNSASAQ